MFIPLNMVRIVSTHCHIQLLLLEKVIYSALMIISHYFSGWQVPLMGYAWIYSIWMVMFGSSLTYSIFLGRTFLSATLKKWTSVSRVWMMISIFSRIPIIVFKKTFLGFALLYTYIYIYVYNIFIMSCSYLFRERLRKALVAEVSHVLQHMGHTSLVLLERGKKAKLVKVGAPW